MRTRGRGGVGPVLGQAVHAGQSRTWEQPGLLPAEPRPSPSCRGPGVGVSRGDLGSPASGRRRPGSRSRWVGPALAQSSRGHLPAMLISGWSLVQPRVLEGTAGQPQSLSPRSGASGAHWCEADRQDCGTGNAWPSETKQDRGTVWVVAWASATASRSRPHVRCWRAVGGDAVRPSQHGPQAPPRQCVLARVTGTVSAAGTLGGSLL